MMVKNMTQKADLSDRVCYQFLWWVCSKDLRQGPFGYAKAKLIVAQQPDTWLEIVPA